MPKRLQPMLLSGLVANGDGLRIAFALAIVVAVCPPAFAQPEPVVVGGEGRTCTEDPQCINRLHPAIPMVARARPGQPIIFHARNVFELDLDSDSSYEESRAAGPPAGGVHPLAGPVHIEGAVAGDTLAVTLTDIDPGRFGYTEFTAIGLVADQFSENLRVLWRLNETEAVSDDLPGVRIPYAPHPGIITVLPGPTEQAEMLAREAELNALGGAAGLPNPVGASPQAVCGVDAATSHECLRTSSPREHGGNMDIRHLGIGATVYLPCYIDGCGLAIGDVHYAQGDGEVTGMAIEMDATVTLTAEVLKDGPALSRGPHYEGPARLLNIPSERFYATTGFPLKDAGVVPPNLAYLDSPHVAGLRNLSKDVTLAARNALLEMIDYISQTYGLTREQAFIVASVAVDLRIGQIVVGPNVSVTAVLPIDIFDDAP